MSCEGTLIFTWNTFSKPAIWCDFWGVKMAVLENLETLSCNQTLFSLECTTLIALKSTHLTEIYRVGPVKGWLNKLNCNK